jgi:Zn-dependent protease with chaperone function
MNERHRFFDGKIARPRTVALSIGAAEIGIVEETGTILAAWPTAQVRVVDQNAVSGTYVLRVEPDQGQRLEVSPGQDLDRLLGEHRQIARWRRRERLALFKGFALWGAVGLVAAGLIYLGWTRATMELAARMPQSWEDKIGDQLAASWFPEARRCQGADGVRALQALGDRIWPGEKDAVKLFVLRRGDPNAFAMPGRRIVVFSGLIDRADNADMLAGVLAHEMGHVELRHPIRGLIHQLGLGAVFALFFGDSSLAGMGQLALVLSYNRDMEREADRRGIALLQRAGLRADGMSAFFAEIKKDGLGKLPAFLSTHPDLDERIAATQQPPTGAPAMSEAEWQALKAVCTRE